MLLYDSRVSGNCYRVRLLLRFSGRAMNGATSMSSTGLGVLRFWTKFAKLAASEAAVEAKLEGGYAALDAAGASSGGFEVLGWAALHDRRHRALCLTHVAHEAGFDLARSPHVRDWLRAVDAQPGHVAIG